MKKLAFLSAILISLNAGPGLASTDNPFADLPKASDFLGDPKEFVKQVEDLVFPVLAQFFTGIAGIYSMAQLIKAMKGPK
jgi:hypothetical protein